MSLSRRQVRLRREYLYRRSLEGREKEVYEKNERSPRRWRRASPSRRNSGRGGRVTRLDELDPSRGGPLNRAPGALDDEYARSLTANARRRSACRRRAILVPFEAVRQRIETHASE